MHYVQQHGRHQAQQGKEEGEGLRGHRGGGFGGLVRLRLNREGFGEEGAEEVHLLLRHPLARQRREVDADAQDEGHWNHPEGHGRLADGPLRQAKEEPRQARKTDDGVERDEEDDRRRILNRLREKAVLSRRVHVERPSSRPPDGLTIRTVCRSPPF